ncbi:MAG: PAS domain S-box protein [Myxococcales bacterium]|nr:PAS domain S-box protein [Myxococcales bacterium]
MPEGLFRALFERSRDLVFLADLAGNFLDANPAALDLLGYRADEISSHSFGSLLSEDQLPSALQQLRELTTAGHLERLVEYQVRCRDGRSLVLELQPSLVRHEGRPDVVLGIGRDLTARKRAEAAGAEAQRFVQGTLDSLAAHICVLDERGAIIATNAAWDRFAEANGVQVAWPGVSYLAVCDAATGPEQPDAAAFAAGLRAVIDERQQEYSLEYPCHAPTEERWFLGRVTRFAGPAPVRVVVAHEDITELVRIERALREAHARLQTILDQSPAMIFAFDLAGRLILSNHKLEELAGRPAAELLGKRYTDLMPPAIAAERTAQDLEIIRTGQPHTIGHVEDLPQGPRTFITTKFPIHDAGGAIAAICGISTDVTELQGAQARLAEREREVRELLERMPIGLVAHGPDSSVRYANPVAVALLGLSQDAMEARKADDPGWRFVRTDGTRMPPEEYPVSRALASGGHVERLELGICRPALADPVWVQCDAHPHRDQDGQLVQIVVTFFDISERKRSAELLQQRDALHASVLSAMREGLVVRDVDDKVLLANQHAADMLGLPLDQLIGTRAVDPRWRAQHEDGTLLPTDELPSIVTSRTGRPVDNFIMSVDVGDPQRRLLSINSREVLDSADRRTSVVTTFHDITEQRRAAQALTELATVVEQASDTILITDLRGAIVYANPAFERSTGYTRAEALGQNPRLLKSGQQDAAFYRAMWAVLKRGEVWSGSLVNRRKDGTLYEEEATISPVRDPRGTVINYAAVKRDVTRERQLERQFLQAQKLESIGQLAGGVAHDFNNILAVIIMESELAALDDQAPAPLQESMREILAAAQRGAKITRQLLLFSRKEVMQPTRIDLNEILLNVAKMLQRLLREDVHLELHLHSGPLITRADAGMLEQVMMNLVVNARDAMPQGGRIVVETGARKVDAGELQDSPEVAAGRYVWLSVNDTGVGIAPEIIPRIFEPFFTTKEVGHGTGLGLASVFGIVKQHHGWLEVESVVGRGTKMSAFLPVHEAYAAEPVEAAPRPSARGGTETVLVVEDDAALRRLMRRALEAGGYRVLDAADGVAARAVWHAHQAQIALVITDLAMPGGVGGRELAAGLQRDQPGLKVIFTSGYSERIAGVELLLDAGQAFVQKPFATDQLLALARTLLDP